MNLNIFEVFVPKNQTLNIFKLLDLIRRQRNILNHKAQMLRKVKNVGNYIRHMIQFLQHEL